MKPLIRYLAIGDSLTEGVGTAGSGHFVDHYKQLAEAGLSGTVAVKMAGRSGDTVGDVLQRVRSESELRQDISEADLITITAGGNDLLAAAKEFYFDQDQRHLIDALKTFQHNMSRLMKEIVRLKAASDQPYCVRWINLYNPFHQFEEAVLWVNTFNRHLRQLEGGNVKIVNVYNAFLGRELDLLSDDFIHPNEEGYRIMALEAHAAGYSPLV